MPDVEALVTKIRDDRLNVTIDDVTIGSFAARTERRALLFASEINSQPGITAG